ELGLAVRALAGVVASALEVVEVHPTHGWSAGGGGDHPCGCAGLQSVQKQVGQQERGEVVEGKRALEAVGRRVSVCPEPADVVDQYVQPRVGVEDIGGEPAHLCLGGHVGLVGVGVRVSRGR